MSEGLSEVGQARAWIHLALEKKMLSQHLKELLTNQQLLRSSFPHNKWNIFVFNLNEIILTVLVLSSPTGSCINLMRSCSVKKKGSSFCSTCSLSTLWTISASRASSPPSVSPVHFELQGCKTRRQDVEPVKEFVFDACSSCHVCLQASLIVLSLYP